MSANDTILTPLRILVAEDSPTQAKRLQHILEQKGYIVTVAANGVLALEAARRRKPTVVISDVVMPEMDGYELCRRLKEDPTLNDVPIILVTTLSDPQDVIRGLECRADQFILKPYDESYLLGRVQFALLNRESGDDRPGMGLKIFFNGEQHFITADRLQILNLLLSTYEAAMQRNRELSFTQDTLRQTNTELQLLTRDLEDRVLKRTQELEETNAALRVSQQRFQSLAESLQTQLTRGDLLNSITRAIGERQDLRSILQVVALRLEDQLPVDFGCMCRYDAEHESLTLSSAGIKLPELTLQLASAEPGTMSITSDGLSECLKGQLEYLPDIGHPPAGPLQYLSRAGLRSVVATPLMVEGKMLGVMFAARRDPNGFNSDEREFLWRLGEQVALAAHQTELHSALRDAYDDLRKTQQAAMQQERLRAVGQMASGVAHDINNAISPISLYTESLLETEAGLSQRARGYLQTIQRAIDDVAQTVGRMREFYRPRDANGDLVNVDLNRLVEQVMQLTRARWNDEAQRRGVMIELSTELNPALPDILGSESEIRDALTNLIFNAIDAMPAGGRIVLRTDVSVNRDASGSQVSQVCLEVSDTGMGMDEETRRRCLEPFFTTKGERGTGLGLAMVYGMAQRHAAGLEIESAIGRGTAMRLMFPVRAAGADATVRVPPAEAPGRSLRILVVDDDSGLLQSLHDTLQADGHQVTAMHGGQAGIDAFLGAQNSDTPFEVVITDLGMPYVDGRKVAQAVRTAAPGTSIVLLTGWGQRSFADDEKPALVDYLLSKPPRLQELRKVLAQCCA